MIAGSCGIFVTPWTIARQAPLSMGFSRQEHWSGCHFLLQGVFLTQGSNPGLLHCRQTLSPLSHQGSLNSIFKVVKKLPNCLPKKLHHFTFSLAINESSYCATPSRVFDVSIFIKFKTLDWQKFHLGFS